MTSPSGAAVDAVREQVKQYFETHITDARDGAVQHLRQVEATAVDTVEATAGRVTGPHVEATRLDREATADHVVEAGGHAQDAAASAGLAAQHSEGVSHAEARAGEHEDLARGHEDEARVQAEASAGHADRSEAGQELSEDAAAVAVAAAIGVQAAFHQHAGVGFPEGKVTAPVGAIYTDTAETAGAIRWIKASGTGPTGWRVLDGQTGIRNVASLLSDFTTNTLSDRMSLMRSGDTVHLVVHAVAFDKSPVADDGPFMTLPRGFWPSRAFRHPVTSPNISIGLSAATGELRPYGAGIGLNQSVSFALTWLTNDQWPSTLPGTPA